MILLKKVIKFGGETKFWQSFASNLDWENCGCVEVYIGKQDRTPMDENRSTIFYVTARS